MFNLTLTFIFNNKRKCEVKYLKIQDGACMFAIKRFYE